MKSEFKISGSRQLAVIDIDGVIGVPEQMQFDEPGDRVATYARFADSLACLQELRVDEVVVNIRSTGGDVNDALMIYDALKGLDAVVTTRCYGYVASAATIIAQAATPGRREISANALYLIHCSESTAEGNAHSLAMTKDLLDKTDIRIASIYSDNGSLRVEDYIALMNENGGKGKWISAEETVDAGLADKVIPAKVCNEASQQEILNDAAELCRMFGLTPPDSFFHNADTDTFGQSADSSRLQVLWRTFLKLIGSGKNDRELKHDAGDEKVPDEKYDICPYHGKAHPEIEVAPELPTDERSQLDKHSVSDDSDVVPTVVSSSFQSDLPKDKTVILANLDLQSEAEPTKTVPVEDPSIEQQRKNANQEAYEQDVMGFRQTF